MRRSHPPGPFVALVAANDNGAPPVDLPTPLARHGTRLCGTVVSMPPSAVEEIRNLHAHRRRYAEALRRLVDGRGAFQETLAAFR